MDKKIYSIPRLTIHGNVETLTQVPSHGNGGGPPTNRGNGKGNNGNGLGNGSPNATLLAISRG